MFLRRYLWGYSPVLTLTFMALLIATPSEVLGSSATIVCDVPYSGKIVTKSESDTLSFTVANSEIVSIATVVTGPSGPNFNPIWRLLRGNGTVVIGYNPFGLYDTGSLLASGNPYRIEIVDSNQDDTGGYRVHLQRLTAAAACEAIPLGCDVPLNGTIEDRVDTDLLSFSVANGEVVSLSLAATSPTGVNFNPYWRLLDRNGEMGRASTRERV